MTYRAAIVGGLVLAFGLVLWAQNADRPKPKPDKPAAPADAAKADKPGTAQEQLEALMKSFEKAQDADLKLLKEARGEEEREKIVARLRKRVQDFATPLVDLGRKHPKDPAAFEALRLVVSSGLTTPEADQAVQLLLKDHLDKAVPLCEQLAQSESPTAEKLIRGVLEKVPEKKNKGLATFFLAQHLKTRSESADPAKPEETAKLTKEAEALFEKVTKDYADVEPLAELAKPELFELRHLSLGKVAPDITGEDSDGKPFKLSDYRGKVVLLDFWATW